MRLIIVGPGRAGGSIALAAKYAGHEIVGVIGTVPDDRYGPPLSFSDSFPPADLALVCVRDHQIETVVDSTLEASLRPPVMAHVSGFVPTTVLLPLAAEGLSIGGFHPLQTLPDAENGAASLDGSYVGVGGDPLAIDTLTHFGISLGMTPFRLSDGVRALYHAAAAAAANFVVTSLTTSADLFDAAEIDPAVARPLVDQVVRNVFESGGRSALTGPIARGDTETVVGHLVAAHEVSESVGLQFRLLAEATAILAGRRAEVKDWK